MSMLAARNISVSRGGARLVGDVSVELQPGIFHTLIGPNGSGKSTVLRALAGLWPVSAGEVALDGVNIAAVARREVARAVSYVPQDTRIDFAFTVQEIVAMGRFSHRGRFENETPQDHAAVDEALVRCDVAALRHRAVNTLSGGERQRVVIARSLAAQARYLLLDEPTANLDIRHAVDIFELCRRLAAQGQAVLLATHDLTAAARYSDGIIVMKAGNVAASGSVATAFTPSVIQDVFGVKMEQLATTGRQPAYIFTSTIAPPDR